MSGVALALAGACLLVTPYTVLAAQRAGSTVQNPSAATQVAPSYFPDRFDWQHKKPEELGMDAGRLDDAVKHAIASENPATKELTLYLATTMGATEPFDTPIGPVKVRGAANGIILRHGYIVAEWGDPKRVDMTFSVTKTFLTTVVGLAWQRGLIHDVNDYAGDYMPPGVDLFEAPHNQKIKWDHLLRQTSDWQGTLWGKPDWADRPEGEKPADWPNRKLWEPGTHYKYNDVRVNVLALAVLNVWRRPLQDVLREEVMEPIDASSTWRWYGYDNSWVEIDGQKIQSVTGGGHWGGGMFINAYDMARFGNLTLRRGKWKDRQLLSDRWIDQARTPTKPEPIYGYMNWFLNTDRKRWPSAPATAFAHSGNGTNLVYVDPEHDLVAVVRWIDPQVVDGFLKRLLAAVDQG